MSSSPSYRRNAIISWTIILGCVGFIVLAVNVFQSMRPSRKGKSESVENLQLRSAARFAVGSHALLAPLVKSNQADAYLASIDKEAKTPADLVHAAIVAGEIDGASAAQKRLAAIQARDDDEDLADDLERLNRVYAGQGDTLSDADRQALLDHHRWYGKLALAYGKPDSDPLRTEALAPARTAAKVLYTMLVAGLLGAVAGLVLLITAAVLIANRSLRRWYVPVVPVLSGRPVFLEAFALYVFLFVVVFQLAIALLLRSTSSSSSSGLGWTMLATLILPLALAWPVWRGGATWRESLLGFGWHLGPPGLSILRVPREMLMGVAGYMAGLPLLALAFFVTTRLSRWADVTPTHPIIKELSAGGWRVAQIYVLACVWAPIMEETMFRGALFNHLRTRHTWFISASIVGVLFAAVHPQGWTFIPVLGTIGVILAGIREWRGGLLASMTAHALNNFVVVTLGVMLLGK